MSAFKAFVEAVRTSTNLVEVVGRDVELRRVGNVLKGLSPFHSEKHASFVVWPKTQTWRDYSSGGGIGGDVFTYVQERDKVGFKDAVLLLAERGGIKPPHQDDETWKRALAIAGQRREVERLLTLAATYYHGCIPDGIRTKYFRQHYGFSEETINQLQLGWSDGGLFEHLTKAGVSRRAALATGLFVPLATGSVVDFFRNRLIFPYWRGGRVVYFTARATELTGDEPWEQSKYKKLRTHSEQHRYISPTVRNDYFYNEDAAREADELVITEGVPDCVSAVQCGVACISPGTTSLRKQDMPRLLELTRHAKRVIICNDSEDSGAGETAAAALAAQLWSERREVCIAAIPRPAGTTKIDVNELVAAQGPEALRAVLAQARPYPEFLLDRIPADAARTDLDRLLEPVLRSLVRCSSIRADVVLEAITARFGVRRRALTAAVKRLTTSDREERAARPSSSPQAARSGSPPPPGSPAAAPASGSSPTSLPQIVVNHRQLRDIVADAWRATHAANTGPQLFARAGRISQVMGQETGGYLATLNEAELYGFASTIADWVRATRDSVIDALPLKEAVRDMLARPDPALPPLEAVVAAPFFDSDGSLVSTPGYHRAARVWFLADGLQVPPVAERPTSDDVAAARALLVDDLLVDFPFTADSDRAHAVGALLLPFVRRLIPDCTPIHLLEAPSPGSGKGLLADLISILILGNTSIPTTVTQDEDETRKKITSILLKAQPIVLLDNIKDVLDSAQLAAALTAETWSDRILGASRQVDLPNRATWLATGNNLQLSMEIARRCVRVRIDAKTDQPWKRTGFKHDPMKSWARAHRGELVHALLVLVQSWLVAGRPSGGHTLGSFEHWARTIGGILDHAGVPGFLEDTNELYEAADAESEEWRELTRAWWERYGDHWVSAGELLSLARDGEFVSSALGKGDLPAQRIRLGKALSRVRDRQFANYRVMVGRNTNIKAAHYRLIDTSASANAGSAPGEQLTLVVPTDETAR